MGRKGDRAAKEPLAKDLYAQGYSLDEVSEVLDVSVTSLSKWKKESKQPDNDLDDWDLTRQGHRDFIEVLRSLFKEQLEYTRGLPVGQRDGKVFDSLSKSAAIVRKWDEIKKAEAASSQVAPEIDRPAVFLENLEWIALKLKDQDPAGLKILGRNFDALILQFKAEHSSRKH